MAGTSSKARIALLISPIIVLAVALSPLSSASAGEPDPFKPAKAKGPEATFHFNAYGPSPNDDVVLSWGEQTLATVRATKATPPVVARALAVVHTAMYDAWAAYDAKALGTRTGGSLRRPASEHTANYKSMAMSYAAYRVLLDLFPSRAGDISGFMTALGYDAADTSTDPATPQGIGNLVAAAVLEFRHADGSNQLGNLNGGAPYSDWTGYQPVNSWNRVNDVYRWQPLCVPTPPRGTTSCAGTVQTFTTPHWGRVTPFALTRPDQFGPPPLARSELPAEAKELVDIQDGLEDDDKTIVSYWADGPGSETPAGHWAMIAAAASRAAGTNLDGNVKLFFALTNGLLDSSIATWNAKRVRDSVRPITYIRWLYAGKNIKGWAGPGKGIVSMDGSNWIPYQAPGSVTPPFAEYTSGHSGFSGASAQVFHRFAGTDAFRAALSVTVPAGSSTIEPKLVPRYDTTLVFKSFLDAAESAGKSRLYGGIHFEQADDNGRALGLQVGEAVWARALTYFNGTAVVPTTSPTATVAPTSTAPTATVAPTATAPTATVAPTTTAPTTTAPTTTAPTTTVAPTATPTVTVAPTTTAVSRLAEVQAAVADLSAAIGEQVNAGQLAPSSAEELRGKVDKIGEAARAGDWAKARDYAAEVRARLGKYLDAGTVTATGYQVLIARLNVVDDALS